jgi:hypothetical protein
MDTHPVPPTSRTGRPSGRSTNALSRPIAQILGRSERRPLTQAEFLRLMTIVISQRIIGNGGPVENA